MENGYLCRRQTMGTAVNAFDYLNRIKPSAIMEIFQDMATAHADQIGVGFQSMKAQNLCWVLNRLSAVIDNPPTVGEDIVVTTYPHKPGLVDAIRDYYITDTNGKSLIRGTSRWCILDITNKAVRRCAPLFSYPEKAYNPQYAVENGNQQLPALQTISGESTSFEGTVHITDLDRNGHMNNARYADIVLNSCDFEFYARHSIQSFDFNFLSEMKYGNSYTVQHKTVDNITNFEAVGQTHTHPIFRAKICWK